MQAHRLLTVALTALAPFAPSACTQSVATPALRSDGGEFVVATGLYPLDEAALRVGGELIRLLPITPAGAEPHEHELTAEQLDGLAAADLVVHIAGFQPALDQAIDAFGLAAVDVGQGFDDPHIWTDPRRQAETALRLGGEFARLDPPNAGEYGANAQRYADSLAALGDEFSNGLARCSSRLIVTGHASFGHLAAAHGLTQIAVTGRTPESEPSAKDLTRLANTAEAAGVMMIYREPNTSSAVTDTLADEIGAEVGELDPVETISADDQRNGADYRSVMRANLASLRKGLRCT
jgi:zinc transport system substrate-binding protein